VTAAGGPARPDADVVRRSVEAAVGAIAADGGPVAVVVRRGEEVLVELAAGHDADGRPFTTRRPVFLYSAVKPVAALAVLTAVARGRLALDDPVAATWPAFAAHGKGAVTVRQALAHAAAVPGWDPPVPVEVLADVVAAEALLAAQPPWWSPGEPGEHATSYGHLLDGILRHATGEDVLSWAGRAAAATGTALSLLPGTGAREPARLVDAGGAWRARQLAAPGLMGRLLREPPELLDVAWLDGAAGRTLVAPAVTGYGSAADLAGLWAWWTGPGGAAHLGAVLRDESLRPQVVGHDHVLDRPVAWGLGPQVDEDGVGMGGVGGSSGWHDTDLGLSVGVTTCAVGPSDRLDPLDDALAALRP
jgi:CubicO group peptidase (beta-lactamase class C family)